MSDAEPRVTEGIRTKIVELDAHKFLSFCREELKISPHILEAAKKDGDISENVKYEHVQQAYRQSKALFINRHRADLASFLQNVQVNTPYPESLPPNVVYKIIDAQTSSGKTWLRYARELLGIEIDDADIVFCNKTLSNEQKHTIIEDWIRQQQASVPDPEGELSRLHQQYRSKKAF